MATKVTMNLLNPSSSRVQFQMPKSRSAPEMIVAKNSSVLTMPRSRSQTNVQKMEIGTNRSALILKRPRGCSSCGR